MQIIITIKSGIIAAAYHAGTEPINVKLLIVDTDGLDVGEPLRAAGIEIDPLREADSEVIKEVARYNSTVRSIEELAGSLDCAILCHDCAYALQLRHYTKEGVQVTRHAPDPCDYHTADEWRAALADGSAAELTH